MTQRKFDICYRKCRAKFLNPVYAVRYRENANANSTYYYYAHNTRGDIVGLYNADGTLHAEYTYDVWGNKLAVRDASNNPISSSTDIANLQPFRYRGYYYDYESGFYYLQSRYYDPVTHRFINADGLVSTGTGVLGFNMFAYCENKPTNYSDSTGMMFDQFGGGGGAIAVPISYGGGGWSSTGQSTAIFIGTTAAFLSFASTYTGMRQEMIAYKKSVPTWVKEKAKAEVIEYADKLEKKNRNKAYYPINPYDFHPKGLVPNYIEDKGNGRIIKWETPINKIAVFEWNEDYKKGPHYHAMLISWDSQHLDGKHYKPGDPVEEPWNTMYFSD